MEQRGWDPSQYHCQLIEIFGAWQSIWNHSSRNWRRESGIHLERTFFLPNSNYHKFGSFESKLIKEANDSRFFLNKHPSTTFEYYNHLKMYTKTLKFYSKSNIDVTLLLMFTPPDVGTLYTDEFPVAWSKPLYSLKIVSLCWLVLVEVLRFPAGHSLVNVAYNITTAFFVSQV